MSLVLELLQRLRQFSPGHFGLIRLDGGGDPHALTNTPERPSVGQLGLEQGTPELFCRLEQELCLSLGDILRITHGTSLSRTRTWQAPS